MEIELYPGDFVVTMAWIEANKTKNGGWKRRQLEQLHVAWPPKKGWKEQAVGLIISGDQKRIFEAFSK